jgi:hypothetical protein
MYPEKKARLSKYAEEARELKDEMCQGIYLYGRRHRSNLRS